MAILVMGDPDLPLTPEHHVYWSSLGRFVHRFAMIEQEIHHLLCLTARTTHDVSLALFSGTRPLQALSFIDRIWESSGLEKDPDFERAKQQFRVINSVRDDVIHHGALLYQNGFLVSNKHRTVPRQQRVMPIDSTALDAMTSDLQTIAATLFVLKLLANGDDPVVYKTDWRLVGRAQWAYMSPPQSSDPAQMRGATTDHLIRSTFP